MNLFVRASSKEPVGAMILALSCNVVFYMPAYRQNSLVLSGKDMSAFLEAKNE